MDFKLSKQGNPTVRSNTKVSSATYKEKPRCPEQGWSHACTGDMQEQGVTVWGQATSKE